MKTILAQLIFLALLSSCTDDISLPPIDEHPFFRDEGESPMVIAHRGGKKLNPENTMLAFDYAASIGVDVLEMDVVLTKDSILVIIHDLTIDDTADTTGAVQDFTFSELQQFNFGYHFKDDDGTYPYRTNPVRIPSLEEVFNGHANHLMMIEIKDEGNRGKLAADQLVEMIHQFDNAQNIIAFSFFDDVMDHFHSINSDNIFSGASFSDALALVNAVKDGTDSLLSIRADVFALPTNLLNGLIQLDSVNLIEAAHRHQKAVHYWTINDEEEMKSLLAKGADALITDRPDLMQQVLSELGY